MRSNGSRTGSESLNLAVHPLSSNAIGVHRDIEGHNGRSDIGNAYCHAPTAVFRSHALSICSLACTHLTAAAGTPAWARAYQRVGTALSFGQTPVVVVVVQMMVLWWLLGHECPGSLDILDHFP